MRLIIAVVVLSVDVVNKSDKTVAHSNVRVRAFVATDDASEASPIEIAPLGEMQLAVTGPLQDHLVAGDVFEIPIDAFQSVRRADISKSEVGDQ